MSTTIQDRLELVFNGELVRRLLVKYFAERGFQENFDKTVYPPILQDICESIPELSGKIEVEPHVLEVDPQGGYARLGWNLFILGNQRMYLGETEHSDLSDLARQADTGQYIVEQNAPTRQARSARDIVTWVGRVLTRGISGIIRTTPPSHEKTPNVHLAGQHTQSMFERPKAIRPEGTSQF